MISTRSRGKGYINTRIRTCIGEIGEMIVSMEKVSTNFQMGHDSLGISKMENVREASFNNKTEVFTKARFETDSKTDEES